MEMPSYYDDDDCMDCATDDDDKLHEAKAESRRSLVVPPIDSNPSYAGRNYAWWTELRLVVNTTLIQASSIVLIYNTWRFQFQSLSVVLSMYRLTHFRTSTVYKT